MSDETRETSGVLEELLRANRNAPEFRKQLCQVLGEFEESRDDQDVFFTWRKAGIQILTDADGHVAAILLFGPGSLEASAYAGPLPGGLRFGMSRDEVRGLLGKPDESRDPKVHLGQALPPWDKYRFGRRWVHARYAADASRIDRVTLMP
jgi:hypothetical protein